MSPILIGILEKLAVVAVEFLWKHHEEKAKDKTTASLSPMQSEGYAKSAEKYKAAHEMLTA
jgi:hypothetical protein